MWNWFNCYLSGRHEYGKWCEPGTIFLRCVHCGRRSPGWAVTEPIASRPQPAKAQLRQPPVDASRVVPFKGRIAS